jgi:hypothetical protein
MSGDDRSWNDGDKLSFSERDRLRREGRASEPRPKGVPQARVEAAKKQYVKSLDDLFSKPSDSKSAKLSAAVRAAHGSPKLAEACRAHVAAVGYPTDAPLLGMFLDAGDVAIVAGALDALAAGIDAESIKITPGLRSQVRMLAEDSDDGVATRAEELVERL